MALNNGFTYPSMNNGFNQPNSNFFNYNQTPIQQPVQTSMQSIVLVNSEQEALNWALAPGNTLFFMNSNEKLFYIKTADFSGMTSFRKFKFEEIFAKEETADRGDVVTREEFEQFKASLRKQNTQQHQQSRKGDKIDG